MAVRDGWMVVLLGWVLVGLVVGRPGPGKILSRVKRQSVFCTQKADIIFVLDSTADLTAEGWDNVLIFMQDLVEEMVIGPDDIQVGVVSYGATARLDFHLNEHTRTETVLEGIALMSYINSPQVNMTGAIWTMRAVMFSSVVGDRPDAPNIVFLVAGSTPTLDRALTVPYAEDAKAAGITIVSVGVGGSVDNVIMELAASSVADHLFMLADSEALIDQRETVAAAACVVPKFIVKEYHLDMETLEGLKLISNTFEGRLSVSPELRIAIIGRGTYFDGATQVLDFGDFRTECFGNLEMCPNGFTYAFWMWYGSRAPLGYIFSSGGQSAESHGLAIYMENGQLTVVASTTTMTWGPISASLTTEMWYHVTVTWHMTRGLIVYIYGVSGATMAAGTARAQAITVSLTNNVMVGRRNDIEAMWGHFVMDEFYFWNSERSAQLVNDFYLNYQWSASTVSMPLTTMASTVIPLVFYLFNMDTDMFTNSQAGGVMADFAVAAVYAQGVDNQALYFDGVQQFLDFGDMRLQCFGNPELCPNGASYTFWIWIGSVKSKTAERQYFISSGAQNSASYGIAIYFEGGMLYVMVSTRSATWGPVSVPVSSQTWYQVAFSWSVNLGLWFYINGIQVGQAATASAVPLVPVSTFNNFVLGRPNDANTNFGEFYMDVLTFESQYREQQYFADFYANFSFIPTTMAPTTGAPTSMQSLVTIDPNACHYADIIFVLDSSGSIGADNWVRLIRFVQDVSALFRVGPQDARIGVVSYGNSARLEFHLNAHTEQADLIASVGKVVWMDSRTNTSGGIWYMREVMFTPENGDRPDAPNIGIVITDGASNTDPGLTIPNAVDAHNDGITLFALGIGAGIVEEELQGIASSQSLKFEVAGFASLGRIQSSIVNAASERCFQALTTVAVTAGPKDCSLADVIFVMDSSGSITMDNWVVMLEFVQGVVANLEVSPLHTQVGVVTYGSQARIQFHLNKYLNPTDAIEAIKLIPWLDEDTNTSGGIYAMKDLMFTQSNGDRSRAPNLGIVMTDGASSRDAEKTKPFSQEAREQGIVLFSIGIGESINNDELLAISGDELLTFHVSNFSALDTIQSRISSLACEIPAMCPSIADIAIVLDTSSSIRTRNFVKIKNFLKEVLEYVNIAFTSSHVALVTFSTKARVEFHLNELDSRLLIQEALDDLRYYRGSTNTAEALRMTREEVFNPANGDRQKIRNIAVVVTDGGSNDFTATVEQARLTRAAGINILVVAISKWVNFMEIHEMATDPDEANAFIVDDFDSLEKVVQGLEMAICDEVNECECSPCMNGGSCVDKVNSFACVCPPSFAGSQCESGCTGAMDLVIALDSSGSIGQDNFVLVLNFIKSLVATLNPSNTQVGLMTFDNQANLKFHMNVYSDSEALVNAISIPYLGGTTNTSDALYLMMEMFTPENGDRPNVPNVALVVTDGRSNNKTETYMAAMQLKATGIKVMAIAIDLNDVYAQRELRALASDPNEINLMSVDDFALLPSILTNLTNIVCNAVDECASNPCTGPGSRCVQDFNSYICICAQGWSGRNCERNCMPQADIAFVVDSSGSIREERFRIIQNFIMSLLSEFSISTTDIRVGLVMFSDDATVQMMLNSFNTKEDTLQAIDMLRYTAGRTNTAAALNLVRTQIFTPENGDRLDVPNFAIVITDGQSNVNPETTLPEAIQTRLAGIQIIVVSVGLDTGYNLEITGIASDPDSVNIMNVTDFDDLPMLKNTLIAATCDDFNECSSNPCRSNAQCLNGIQNYLCDCQDVYTGYNCERRCNKRYDVVILIDASGSIAGMEYTFDLSLRLSKELVNGLNFAQGRTRVGVMTFSDDPQIRFNLQDYLDKLTILNALALTPEFGKTATAKAIDMAQNTMFTAAMGDREGVPNVMLVISDGYSNVDRETTIPTADAARAAGTTIFSIGVGHDGCLDPDEIRGIGNTPDYQYSYIMPNTSSIVPVAQNILDILCDS